MYQRMSGGQNLAVFSCNCPGERGSDLGYNIISASQFYRQEAPICVASSTEKHVIQLQTQKYGNKALQWNFLIVVRLQDRVYEYVMTLSKRITGSGPLQKHGGATWLTTRRRNGAKSILKLQTLIYWTQNHSYYHVVFFSMSIILYIFQYLNSIHKNSERHKACNLVKYFGKFGN